MTWPLSQIRDSPKPGRPGPLIYFPQEQGDPVIPPGTGFLFVVSYDSQGEFRYFILMAVASFPWQPDCAPFSGIRGRARCSHKIIWDPVLNVCYFCPILTNVKLCQQILVKLSNINRHENASSCSQAASCGETSGQTDRRCDNVLPDQGYRAA
jgi:hypothetical protein